MTRIHYLSHHTGPGPSLSPCTGSRLPGLTRQGGKRTLQRPKEEEEEEEEEFIRIQWIL